MKFQCVDILLVEDNPGDIKLTQTALEFVHVVNKLHIVENGEQALDFLYQRGSYANAIRPHLILLDLNLPRVNGREVLKKIKNDPTLMDIPICILTGSKAEEDILKSYKLHANCYIVKPVDIEHFINIAKSIENFWFNIATIPDPSKRIPKK